MTTDEFCDWLKEMDYLNTHASVKLGVSVHAITKYKQGYPIPKYISNQCTMLLWMKNNVKK